MKILTLVCLAMILSSCLAVSSVQPATAACTCAQIQYQTDCGAAQTKVNGTSVACLWTPNANATGTAAKGTCSAPSITTPVVTSTTTYCTNVTTTACPTTLGCALADGKTCTPFTGCSAYIKTTDAACQAISNQCTSDGTQCMQKAACSTYSAAQCTNTANSGSGTCKVVNNACVDQSCSDVTTQSVCTGFQGTTCVWNGATCSTALTTCATTVGNATSCPLITGSDGPCKYVTGSTNCSVKTCADALPSVTTNAACVAFLSSCLYTNGKGCVSTLAACSTYLQSNTCTGYIGSDGPCVTDSTSTTACRAQQCTDAATTLNTDTACAAFKSGCVTTGQGCTGTRSACSSYNGTTTTCANYIGSDGNCKGSSTTTSGPCAAKVCTDNTTATTNAACATFQTGCITTGRGCVATSLPLCSSYTVAANGACDGLIGSDGNCTLATGSTTTCAARVCTAATSNTTTNAGCQTWSPNCVTNGTTCVAFAGTCESQPTVLQCQGSSTCLSTGVCNDNTTCTSYGSSQSMCLLNKAGQNGYLRQCNWSNGTCIDYTCAGLTPPANYMNDNACTTALLGCVYSGATAGGCVEPNAGCSAFQGNNTASSLCATVMNKTCWGSSSSVGACVARTCSSYNGTTATSDSICATFLTGCVSDGNTGCITANTCDKYNGSESQCKAITSNTDKGGLGKYPCVPATAGQSSGACRAFTCADIIIGSSPWPVVTSSQCSTVNVNCTTSFAAGSGKQCIPTPANCSSYKTSLPNCLLAITTTAKATCSKYSQLCAYQAPQTCASYASVATDTLTNQIYCQGVSDGTNLCGFVSGAANCAAQSTITACTGFAVASSTATTNFAYCQTMKSSGSTNCGYTTGSTTCVTFACSQVTPLVASDCYTTKGTTCAFANLSGTLSCIAKATTSCVYPLPQSLISGTTAAKLAWCIAIRDSATMIGCGYVAGATSCSDRALTDLNNTSYPGFSQAICNGYMPTTPSKFSGFTCEPNDRQCTPHTIPTTLNLSLQQKYQLCNAIEEQSKKNCSWDGSATTCISGAGISCTSYPVATASLDNVLVNQKYCSSLMDGGGAHCTYNDMTGAATSCGSTGAQGTAGCATYAVLPGSGDFANQLYCASLLETIPANRPCTYVSGASFCSSTTGTICSDATYTPLASITRDVDRIAVCYAYAQQQCGYATNGTVNTSSPCVTARQCKDLGGGVSSQVQCENYRDGGICLFNSATSACYQVTACTSYPYTSLSQCGTYVNSSTPTQMCGYKTGDSACKVKACSDITNAAKASDCSSYLNTCIFDGTGICRDIQSACSGYTYTTGQSSVCSVLSNAVGQRCTIDSTSTTACTERSSTNGCAGVTVATTNTDCSNWGGQCLLDTAQPCADQVCTENTTATSNAQCSGQCIWNGTTGCVLPTVACSTFKGTDATCRGFIGNSKPCYQPNSAGTATSPCADLSDCTANTTATSDQQCEAFWPSTKAQGANYNCQWNGTTGCVAGRSKNCASFSGTIDTCPKFTGATDAPCKGTGNSAAACVAVSCSDAPNTATTDAMCNTFKTGCVTTGSGCQSPSGLAGNTGCQTYQNQASCTASKLGLNGITPINTCAWTTACITGLTSCSGTTASSCVITTVSKTALNPLGTCSWYLNNGVGACRATTCADLPATNTQDSQCSALISTCTTNGAGCVTKGACSTYTTSLACTSAATTDTITKCTWVPGSGCRMQQCADNTFTQDAACNINGLKTCRTTGTTCIAASALQCSNFATAAVCLKDGNNSPCLWINNACYSYTGCTSIAWTTHAQCQLILTGATTPQCTSDGTKCQPLNSCTNYKSTTTSCVVGNDASVCGMLPANSGTNTSNACQKFGSCTDAKGATNDVCQLYGSTCISNGTGCQVKATCASYTQVACSNAGTDGACFWSTTTNACRTQQCGDATTNNTTDAGCAAFPAPYINTCTTNGTTCISRSTCSTYTVQAGCVMGTDGACFWVAAIAPATGGVCRVKVCSDLVSTTTPGCQNQIISSPATTTATGTTAAKYLACVSNGTNCIAQANCATYTNLAACSGRGYGLDGTCAFTPTNTTTPTVGTCKLVNQCTDAGVDAIACGIYSDRCQYKSTTSGNTTTSSCVAQDCASKSGGSTCQPVPSWDLSTYSLCLPVSSTNSTCQNADGAGFTSATCFSGSAKTYTWNDTQGACTYCGASSVTVNNTNTNTNTSNSSTTYGEVITSSFLVFGALFATY